MTVDAQIEDFELSGRDADAKGAFTDDGFLVKAGSLARCETVPSSKSVNSVHQRLLNEGVLEEHDGELRFAKDHLFKSPSGAAAAFLGRMDDGWISRNRADGQTLREIKRISRDVQAQLLDEYKRKETTDRHQQLLNEGKLPTAQQLDKEYAVFQEKFGPHGLSRQKRGSLIHCTQINIKITERLTEAGNGMTMTVKGVRVQ